MTKKQRLYTSIAIILLSLGLTYIPLPSSEDSGLLFPENNAKID